MCQLWLSFQCLFSVLTFHIVSATLSAMTSLPIIGAGMLSAYAGRCRPGAAEKRFLINYIGRRHSGMTLQELGTQAEMTPQAVSKAATRMRARVEKTPHAQTSRSSPASGESEREEKLVKSNVDSAEKPSA